MHCSCSTPFLTDGNYTNLTLQCWAYFVELMRDVRTSDLCEWKIIIRYRAAECRGWAVQKGSADLGSVPLVSHLVAVS